MWGVGVADKDWSLVEPAIFGTLLERALDVRERSRLGAHYTPRSYVERLVKPVVMEPLRSQWAAVEMEVDRILQLEAGKLEPTVGQRKKAEGEIRSFLMTLQSVRILDPACGSGNFLYVTLDLLKTLEMEVLQRWVDVTGSVQLSVLEQVKPSQFLGIEVNPRAAAIAELVIWIGYLQWHFKRFGNVEPPEPVLVAYGNIECRDAVLEWDRTERDVDKDGKVRSRWGGRLMRHPVTGEEVPDPTDQVEILRYVNPRAAVWPEADYIVSNPPFVGNKQTRDFFGDGYVEALRKVYSEVPDTVDYVMYWWSKAASSVQLGRVRRFGFITTNTIRQIRQRKVIKFYQSKKQPVRLFFAIPDYPWADGGAAVRIAMTGAEKENNTNISRLGTIANESEGSTPEDSADGVLLSVQDVGQIFSDLRAGVSILASKALKATSKICSDGVKPYASGFTILYNQLLNFPEHERFIIRPYLNGRDLAQESRKAHIIDCFGLTESNIQADFPTVYQWILDRVYPTRATERNGTIKSNWWLFERSRPDLRKALSRLNRYIVTVKTSKHRVFIFLDCSILPDQQLVAIASDDAYFLSILSSKVHVTWALAAGGTLEDRPRYNNSVCFDPFPFPDPTDAQKQTIRELGD